MLKYYSADYVFPVNELPIRRGVVAVDSDGVIDAVYSGDEAFSLGDVEIERYPGMLIPGFINTHCHLELSHLKDRIKPKGDWSIL
jgi:cytosine/adenosine deaminase-related metal-dependent hydrolase